MMKGNSNTSKKQEVYYKAPGNNKGSGKSKSNPLRVKYISSPMKVTTTTSRFRSLVQQLTGKNSNTDQYVVDTAENAFNVANDDFHEIGSYFKTGSSYEDCQVQISPSGFS